MPEGKHAIHSSTASRQDFKAAVLEQGCALLPRLRTLAEPQLTDLIAEVDAINQVVPLSSMPGQRFVISTWDSGGPLSSVQIVALLVFGLWVLSGEDVTQAEHLIEQWPSLPQVVRTCPTTGLQRIERMRTSG